VTAFFVPLKQNQITLKQMKVTIDIPLEKDWETFQESELDLILGWAESDYKEFAFETAETVIKELKRQKQLNKFYF
tara:strand:+ start:390 stop:617 length:228 start_codon:yes stop_codon:yes gene_type:complete